MRMLLMLSMAVGLFGQAPAEQYTGGALNCRFWNSMGHEEKSHFTLGYFEGVHFAEVDAKIKIETLPRTATIGETVKGIDEICSVPENARIPINWDLALFNMKVQGASDARVRELTEQFRKISVEGK